MKKIVLFALASLFAPLALAAHLTIRPDTVASPIAPGTLKLCSVGAHANVIACILTSNGSATCYLIEQRPGKDCMVINNGFVLAPGDYPVVAQDENVAGTVLHVVP